MQFLPEDHPSAADFGAIESELGHIRRLLEQVLRALESLALKR